MNTVELLNKGSLITYKDGENEVCLGYLFDFTGEGIFDATLGKVEVTPEEMEIHNRLFDEALLTGLDENCEVGQEGTFYFTGNGKVTTWMGTVVSEDVVKRNRSITFKRAGKTYRGVEQNDADCFNFKRIQ